MANEINDSLTYNRGSDNLILVISSYNPETNKIAQFSKVFEEEISKDGGKYEFLIENLQCDNINEAFIWIENFKNILQKYDIDALKSVVILGQEAWATYYVCRDLLKELPVFVCYAGRYGLDLSYSDRNFKNSFHSIDFIKELAKDKSYIVGGQLFEYDLKTNIKISNSFYPDNRNAILITDNTYGGITLNEYYKIVVKDFPNIRTTYIDTREFSQLDANITLKEALPNTSIFVGTWRVARDGSYLMTSSLRKLLRSAEKLPKFSLMGQGMGDYAIAGCYSSYDYNPAVIYYQIRDYYNGSKDAIKLNILPNNLNVDRDLYSVEGLNNTLLPDDAVILTQLESTIKGYKKKLAIYISSTFLLLVIIFFFLYLIVKSRILRKKLILSNKNLLIAKEKAEESEKLKISFIENMSHEIRTPLNAIVGFSSLMIDDSVSIDEKSTYIPIINKNSEDLIKIVYDVLDLSSLQSGTFVFNNTKLDFIKLSRDTFTKVFSRKLENVEYSIDLPSSPCWLEIDQNRVVQILSNILSNAQKFTSSGFINMKIEVDRKLSLIRTIITDSGLGIDKENIDKVFDYFEKENSFGQGAGIGLSLSRCIVRNMGGDIFIDESYSSGCRIIIELRDVEILDEFNILS